MPAHVTNTEGLKPWRKPIASTGKQPKSTTKNELLTVLGILEFMASVLDHFTKKAVLLYEVPTRTWFNSRRDTARDFWFGLQPGMRTKT